ncbi:MAG: ABC transporter substrate-binding protein [Nitratireductor sp.]|nr:ABC transporter substrate-binding protein [Nitratireductor sp.]
MVCLVAAVADTRQPARLYRPRRLVDLDRCRRRKGTRPVTGRASERFFGHLPFSRRDFLRTAGGGAAALALASMPRVSLAGNPSGEKLHGLSSFGDLKYPADFARFGYAAPDAPKGGRFAFQPSYWYFNQNTQTFNTLNSFILKGEAPPRMEHCFDTLMVWAWDEPDAVYCALAATVEISPDRNTYRFVLRPEARFHDGSPVTAEDVAFSFMVMKEKGHPQISLDLANLAEAVATDAATVELRFNGRQSDRAILSVAMTVPVLSKAFNAEIPFDDQVMQVPLSSGPWKVGRRSPGLFIEYERNRDYWAKDLPFARGLDHFDTLRIDFFRERQPAFEAFKKGDVRWREEFTSKIWATEYVFPAVTRGDVVKTEVANEKRAALQGWAVNTRRGKFSDPLTRQAIATVFDFEWTNRNIFYGAYKRSQSMFEGSAFAAMDPPSADELILLEPYRDRLPESVFGAPVRQFETDGSGNDRAALRQATRLLRQAGWRRSGDGLVNDRGETLSVEFLIRAQVFERLLGPYAENLRSVGIGASIRLVDASQFQARLESFDFDIVGSSVSFGATPSGETMRQYFHSENAARSGSLNYPGIKIEAVDQLVAAVDAADSREALTTAMRALDRVLRAYFFWIPNWHSETHRIAMWNEYGWQDPKPGYFFPVERLWWFDADKAAKLSK